MEHFDPGLFYICKAVNSLGESNAISSASNFKYLPVIGTTLAFCFMLMGELYNPKLMILIRFLVVGLGMKNHGFFDSKCCLVQKKLKINKRTLWILWPGTDGRSFETCRMSAEPCWVAILNSILVESPKRIGEHRRHQHWEGHIIKLKLFRTLFNHKFHIYLHQKFLRIFKKLFQ